MDFLQDLALCSTIQEAGFCPQPTSTPLSPSYSVDPSLTDQYIHLCHNVRGCSSYKFNHALLNQAVMEGTEKSTLADISTSKSSLFLELLPNPCRSEPDSGVVISQHFPPSAYNHAKLMHSSGVKRVSWDELQSFPLNPNCLCTGSNLDQCIVSNVTTAASLNTSPPLLRLPDQQRILNLHHIQPSCSSVTSSPSNIPEGPRDMQMMPINDNEVEIVERFVVRRDNVIPMEGCAEHVAASWYVANPNQQNAGQKRPLLENRNLTGMKSSKSKRVHLADVADNHDAASNSVDVSNLATATTTCTTKDSSRSSKGSSRKPLGPALNTNLMPRAPQGTTSDPQTVSARVFSVCLSLSHACAARILSKQGHSLRIRTRECMGTPSTHTETNSRVRMSMQNRRERIKTRLKVLQELLPDGSKVDLVTMLEKAINYVKFLQLQITVLSDDNYWQPKGQDQKGVIVKAHDEEDETPGECPQQENPDTVELTDSSDDSSASCGHLK